MCDGASREQEQNSKVAPNAAIKQHQSSSKAISKPHVIEQSTAVEVKIKTSMLLMKHAYFSGWSILFEKLKQKRKTKH